VCPRKLKWPVTRYSAGNTHHEKVPDVREPSAHLFGEDGSAFQTHLSLYSDDDLVLADAAAQIEGIPVLDFFLRILFVKQ